MDFRAILSVRKGEADHGKLECMLLRLVSLRGVAETANHLEDRFGKIVLVRKTRRALGPQRQMVRIIRTASEERSLTARVIGCPYCLQGIDSARAPAEVAKIAREDGDGGRIMHGHESVGV